MTTVIAEPGTRDVIEVPISSIAVGDNIREPSDIDGLALSIQTVGILVPLIVTEADNTDNAYVLVAGHRRLAAAKQAGLDTVPVMFTDAENAATDQAIENIAREQLTPAQEASALKRMLDAGLTQEGARDALGWSSQRAAARAQLLALPDFARDAFDGRLKVSLVPWFDEIHRHLGERVLKCVVAYIVGGGQNSRQLETDTHYFFQGLNRAYREKNKKAKIPALVFPLGGTRYDPADEDGKWLGLSKPVRDHAAAMVTKEYGFERPYRLEHFDEQLYDEARAAGILFEVIDGDGENQRMAFACVSDVDWFKDAVARQVETDWQKFEKRTQAEAKKKAKTSAQKKAGAVPEDEPLSETASRLRRENDRAVRAGAHDANLRLYEQLRNTLDQVKPDDVDVARVFVGTVLGRPSFEQAWSDGATSTSESLAAAWRLIAPECRTTETTKQGKLKVTYVDRDQAEKLMWKYLDGAKTAAELFGRTLVVISARQLCVAQAVPRAQQPNRHLPRSKGGVVEKALARIWKAATSDPPAVRKLRNKGDNFDGYKAAEKARTEQAKQDSKTTPADKAEAA